jgi:regulator of replication initiation timing
MLKQLYEWAKWLLLLAQETRQNRTDIKELREEVAELSAAVQRLAYEIHRIKENEAHEHEKLALKLENEMLRFERRLPTGQKSGETTDAE